MKSASSFLSIFSAALLIAGNMIGAGMLGLPLMTGMAGFFPSMISTLSAWLFMYCTGLLLLEVTLWMPDGSNVLSISRRFLGRWGPFLSGGLFIFLYYCLMIAYFAAGTPLFAKAMSLSPTSWKSFALFGAIFAVIVAIGPKFINRTNIILSISMVITWFVLLGGGGGQVRWPLLIHTQWSAMPFTLPILFGAFGFHNVIPSLCTYLKRDRRALRFAIFFGSLLPLIVYLIWQWLIIGTIPKDIIEKTMQNGIPITAAFQEIAGRTYFVLVGQFFSFFAIVTSVLGVSFSMVDFLGDGCKIINRIGWRRVGLTLLTFFPPFILATLNPHVFLTSLGIAGGLGEAFLNGLLPIALFWMGKRKKYRVYSKWLDNKKVLGLLKVYALFVIGLEIYHLIQH